MSEPAVKYDSGVSLLLRLFCFFGLAAVAYTAIHIYLQRVPFFAPSDLLLFALTGALVVARYCDVRWLQGLNMNGDPATLAHWRRYAAGLLLAAVACWLLAHGVGSLVPQAPAGR